MDSAAGIATAHTIVELTYFPEPLFVDRRGAVAGAARAPVFTSYDVQPQSVSFTHAARWMRVDSREARLIAAGEALTDEALSFLFQALSVAGVETIASVKLSRFFAVATSEPVDALLKAQRAAITALPFEPDSIGVVDDFAMIFSLKRDGRDLGFQFGPMTPEQWVKWRDRVREVVDTLPPGWAAGIYDQSAYKVNLSLKDTKHDIEQTFEGWKTLVMSSRSQAILR